MKRDKTKPLSYRVRYLGCTRETDYRHAFLTTTTDRADKHEFRLRVGRDLTPLLKGREGQTMEIRIGLKEDTSWLKAVVFDQP